MTDKPIHKFRCHAGWPGCYVDVTARTAAEARRIAEQREPGLTVRWVEYRGARPNVKGATK